MQANHGQQIVGTDHAATAAPKLRPYQAHALERAREHYRQGHKRGVIVAPTGSGKSVLFGAAARGRVDRGGRVLIVVHRRELLTQAVGHLRRAGLSSVRTIVGGQALGDPDAPVTVAAVQSLTATRWRDRLPRADLVIWDETHHIKARSFLSVYQAYPEAHHLGFTATPERADGSPLGDVYDFMVVVASVAELTDQGYLAPCEVIGPAASKTALAEDAAVAYMDHGRPRRAIVFCSNVTHSRETTAALLNLGVRAAHVDGTMPTRERDQLLARFGSGDLDVITNANLISEGFDVPACKCVVIARGCDSVAMFMQICGRAMRPDGSNQSALVIDLRGAVHKHGMPDAERTYSLDGEAIRTQDVEPVKQCKRCGACFRPAVKCPRCGHTSPLPESPEVRRERLEKIADAHTEDQRREYWERLQAQAVERGYKAGWAYHKYKSRYGSAPRFGRVA